MLSAAEGDARQFCYVSISEENRIAAFAMNLKTGKLTHIGNAELDGSPGSLGVHPNNRFLYAAVRSTKSVSLLHIDQQSGSLSLQQTIPVVENPVYVVTDRTGKFLLMASYNGGQAAVYRIADDQGRLDPEPVEIIRAERNPHSILTAPSNRFVYVPNTGSDTILQFRFDQNEGRFTPLEPSKVVTDQGAGPRHFVFHPTRDFVYFVNETNSSVTAYRLDPNRGVLTAIQSLSTLPADFEGRNSCADIEITPDGKYLYASNRGHDSLAGYSVNSETGRLTALGQTPTEKTPREFAIDPTGQFVYSAGQGSGRLASYRIDGENGRLVPLEIDEVGQGPAWVTIVRIDTD